MELIALSFCISSAGILLIPLLPVRARGGLALFIVILHGGLSSSAAILSLSYGTLTYTIPAGFPFGPVPLRIDPLSAFFILVITITLVSGAWYGRHYMKAYNDHVRKISFHWCVYVLLQASMSAVCMIQNALAFLVAWEIMTVASFLLIIFEHEKENTVRAGLNFFIQSHLCIVFLVIGFIWASNNAGSLDFADMMRTAKELPDTMGQWPFMFLFAGFAFKAGFVPFHTWLPWAHPAAPSHVSGVMSGIIIKLGIFGIFRSLLFYPGDMTKIGRLILIISVVTALYGVMLAIIQHNLKRLLAYHSIENIGIIGMGIGIGAIGAGSGNSLLAMAGYSGALLHTLNHSLFKSLLFYTAGTVYQKTHTLNVENLGGLVRVMPHTALLFLVAALAICGLPPFNGFISEFLVYSGLFQGMLGGDFPLSMLFLCSAFGLVTVGGLAFLCFTKAFGVVFLGTPRHPLPENCTEADAGMLFPQYMVMALILAIGLVPAPFFALVSLPASMYVPDGDMVKSGMFATIDLLRSVSVGGCAIIALSGALFLVKRLVTRDRPETRTVTWGCGYAGSSPRLQYTATSFVRTYTSITSSVLRIFIYSTPVKGFFPQQAEFHTKSYDRIEEKLIDKNLDRFGRFLNIFGFLQNGHVQFYILYGVFFIITILAFSFRGAIFSYFMSFFALR